MKKKITYQSAGRYMLLLLLLVTTFLVFSKTKDHDFIFFDDNKYITENIHVQSGLTLKSLRWALTATENGDWNPLSWISHIVDYELFGLNPAGHHLTNVVLHVLNTLLLFLVLSRMTGAFLRSGFVAALFALHPLHVESVAWIAERKDVLSTLFWMSTLLMYVHYAAKPTLKRYAFTLFFFACGLLSKPMVVTLPFVLILLDYWPLKRMHSLDTETHSLFHVKSAAGRILLEKVPFFGLSLAAGIVTLLVKKSQDITATLGAFPLDLRVMNAALSYVEYIIKMFLPLDLSVFYPLQVHALTAGRVSLAVSIIFAVSLFVFFFREKHRYLVVGWLWYVVTLLPVIGIVQVGMQRMADRYTYIPLTGLFIIIVWGISDLFAKIPYKKVFVGSVGGLVLFGLTMMTSAQLNYWKNSFSLFGHAVEVTEDNFVAYNNLGYAFAAQGKNREAIPMFSKAMTVHPAYSQLYYIARYNMGYSLIMLGQCGEAAPYVSEAIVINPKFAEAHNLLGYCAYRERKFADALTHYSESLRIKPDFIDALNNMAVLLTDLGRFKEAEAHYRKALNIRPDAGTLNNLGTLLFAQGRYREAVDVFTEALRLDPQSKEAQSNITHARAKLAATQESPVPTKE